jgi:signal transduction histidine kinase
MRASRTSVTWGTLALCALAVITGMGWLTYRSIEHQKKRAQAEANQRYAELRADIEERTRLSLWRMDAYATSLIGAENQIPANDYLHFSIAGSYEKFIQCRFEIDQTATLKLGNSHTLGKRQTQQLRNVVISLPADIQATAQKTPSKKKPSKKAIFSKSWGRATKQEVDSYQTASNLSEKSARSDAFDNSNRVAFEQSQKLQDSEDSFSTHQATVSPFKAIWRKDQLFFWRTIQHPNKNIKQGAWLDHSALTRNLLTQIEDLLPSAHLAPISLAEKVDNPLALVSLPFLLVTNENTLQPPIATPKLDQSLLIAWAGALIALLACAVLIRGIMRLSERRASFVSAVTHELRTPLTTFQLYTDILQNNILTKEKNQTYLSVLSRESKRLAHLVENVLVFSKLEKGSAKSNIVSGDAKQLLEPLLPRFQERLETAELELQVNYPAPFSVSVDTNKLEHIIFNLIDNAAKYATPVSSPIVHLTITQQPNTWKVVVQDHGPGIPKAEQAKIFRAFHKSAHQAAESCPGVGLGLALSLRLAESMHGKLQYSNTSYSGASFTLTLPIKDKK